MDGVYIASITSGPSMLWFLNLSHTIADVPVQFRIKNPTHSMPVRRYYLTKSPVHHSNVQRQHAATSRIATVESEGHN